MECKRHLVYSFRAYINSYAYMNIYVYVHKICHRVPLKRGLVQHTALKLHMRNINRTWNANGLPIVWIWDKIDRVMTAPRCKLQACFKVTTTYSFAGTGSGYRNFPNILISCSRHYRKQIYIQKKSRMIISPLEKYILLVSWFMLLHDDGDKDGTQNIVCQTLLYGIFGLYGDILSLIPGACLG